MSANPSSGEIVNDEVVKPDRIGSMDPEVTQWEPPSPHRKEFLRRVFEIQQWIKNHGFVYEEEIIRYARRRWNVSRETARSYMKEVEAQFKKKGIPVIGED